MTLDIQALLRDNAGAAYDLHEKHANGAMVQFLKMAGFAQTYVRAEGPYLFDSSGNKYLDFVSSSGAFAIGRNHPALKKVLHDTIDADLASLVQLDAPLLAGILAERLVARAPWLEKVFFCNSGTEAVEAAIKIARAATGRPGILYCHGAFHGMTYGSLSVCGREEFLPSFGPFVPECRPVSMGDASALEEALSGGDVAAFIVEPIQGRTLDEATAAYWKQAHDLCKKHGTILVFDEIFTGCGRTGRFLVLEHYGVEPDMVLLSKALSGGAVPMGAALVRRGIFEAVFSPQRPAPHGSTFAKNVLAMAACLATLQIIDDEKLVERAARMGELFRAKLEPMLAEYAGLFQGVRGRGLMLGLEVGVPEDLLVVGLFAKHRILTAPVGKHLKIVPPLIVSEADVDWFCSAVGDLFKQFRG